MDFSPLGDLFALLFIVPFILLGFRIALAVMHQEHPVILFFAGGIFGLLLLTWLPTLFSFIMGFTILSHMCAVVTCVIAFVLLTFFAPKRKWRPVITADNKREIELLPLLLCVIPTCAIALFILYRQSGTGAEGIHVSQAGYGDLSMHYGIITSIATQGVFPPNYSIMVGQPMSYPFLCDSVSSSLYLLGADLKFAYMAPMVLALPLTFLGYYLLARRVLGKARSAVLAFVFFFLGGGFGFAYFFEGAKADPGVFTEMFTGFYKTPTNLIDNNIRWVNPIVDMLIPQRATTFGWTYLMFLLYFLYRAAFEKQHKWMPLLGVCAGLLPLIHTHSFLALGVISVFALLVNYKDWKSFIPYALICLLLAAPQLINFTFKETQGFVRLHFNWANNGDWPLWFYIKNLGPVLFLVPIGFLQARKKSLFALCALPLWVLSEIIVFTPNTYDNNKLLFASWMLFCLMAAYGAEGIWRSLQGIRARYYIAICALVILTASSALTIAREMVSDYRLFSDAQVRAAAYIKENTPKDAVFLTAGNHNNTVAALTGRNIVLGSPSYLYYHGVYDMARYQDVQRMFQDEGLSPALLQHYSVSYVYISSYEMGEMLDPYLFSEYPIVFEEGDIAIYRIAP